jgi:hypothetical protein
MWIRARERRNVDDVSTAAFFHFRNRRVTAMEDAEEIRFEHGAEIFRRGLLDRLEDANARLLIRISSPLNLFTV